jgi:hypothetical protein
MIRSGMPQDLITPTMSRMAWRSAMQSERGVVCEKGAVAKKAVFSLTNIVNRKRAFNIYNRSYHGRLSGNPVGGMWRIRSSCIWVLQKYPCATGVSLNRRHAYRSGSVTQRFLCIPVQSTTECTTRGKEPWHCPPKGEAEAHTRKPCHAKMSSRAPAKPCVRATFV